MSQHDINDQTILQTIQYVKDADLKHLSELVEELQPYDLAQLYMGLPDKSQIRFLLMLKIDDLAQLMGELENGEQIKVLNRLGRKKANRVLDLMENDDLATLFDELPDEEVEDLLAGMNKAESTAVKDLMNYPPETAGRLMTNRFVWIKENYTVRKAVDKLKSFAEIAESINYLYVINEEKQLVGVVSYRDLILAELSHNIRDIMYTRVISVPAETDQEEVARIIERYDFLAIPVVETDSGRLAGIVTVDDVLDIVIEEANEDIEKLSASGKAIDFNTKSWVAAYRRLPWLILLLFIGVVSGSIISGFEETLHQVVALAFFMPMVAGMTGNTGTQSLAVVVRGLVSNDLEKNDVIKLIFRELMVGILIGVTCGILISIIAYVWQGSFVLGIVVGCSLLITLIIGTMAGTIIPLILYKLNIDPAIASGPLITTLSDIFSLLVYFGLATLFISYLL